MTFIWPWMLLSLLLVPLFVGAYLWLQDRRQQAAAALGPLGVVVNRSGQAAQSYRHVPPLLFLGSLTLLLFGLSRPEMPVALPRVEGTVILAFDVSRSMLADDLEPSRIDAAKAAARTFVENQPATIQLGVVAFSNGGLVVQPPTADRTAVLDTIERLTPQGATSLGQGIFTALNAIAGEPLALDTADLEAGAASIQLEDYGSAVVVLLTDGENTSSPEPLDIAQIAAEAGVRIYPVGIGSPEGAVLEVDGFQVLTQLNEPALQDIARLTNGTYYQAADEASLQEIYQNIDLQLTVKGEKMEITAILAGLGLLLLLIGGALSLLWFGRMP